MNSYQRRKTRREAKRVNSFVDRLLIAFPEATKETAHYFAITLNGYVGKIPAHMRDFDRAKSLFKCFIDPAEVF